MPGLIAVPDGTHDPGSRGDPLPAELDLDEAAGERHREDDDDDRSGPREPAQRAVLGEPVPSGAERVSGSGPMAANGNPYPMFLSSDPSWWIRAC